ncbi:cardiolipin synthase [Bacillus sp. HMF5848]|uniref:cardiolipin synthase n=1 Tax=Bacillus sp. HMF5848 TaxID=2495421 RepID=UPI0021ADD223|nr:cardiolipin synthase [Bacillus sp. HMF5848]
MSGALIILLAILLLFALITLDYIFGLIHHQKVVKLKKYKHHTSNLTLFTEGNCLFTDYFREIDQARHHIHVLFYIVKNDDFSKSFLDLLKKKATEGVEVRLLVDWFGSRNLKKKSIKELEETGVKFAYAERPRFPFFFFHMQQRNHRKITVIDGLVGYMGGFNVGKEYISKKKKFGHWRDYHLKVTGPGVHDLQDTFIHDWEKNANDLVFRDINYFPEVAAGRVDHQLVPTDGVFLEKEFINMIADAKEEIIIGSPYFIPSKRVFQKLMEQVRKGVKVSVIVPKKSDHPLVKEASYPYLKKLLEQGGRVFEYGNGFYHAKVIVIDDVICDVGTANFDKRSLYLNFEMNCYIFDGGFIRDIKRQLRYDFNKSKPLSVEDIKQLPFTTKIKVGIAQLLSHFL